MSSTWNVKFLKERIGLPFFFMNSDPSKAMLSIYNVFFSAKQHGEMAMSLS